MTLKSFKEKLGWFFGFKLEDLSSYPNFIKLLFEPRHSSSLGVARILFGFLMLIDIFYERDGLRPGHRWGDSYDCHFPLFSGMKPPHLMVMCFIYGFMSMGALGITLGYKFKYNTAIFIVTFWYLLLLDKTYWNNHSYLFGLVAILFLGSSADRSYSLDSYLQTKKPKEEAPFWNYFILRFQFFLLYFLAGIKKFDAEWLGGHSMTNLGKHWVFIPFQLFLDSEQIDYLVVHWMGFLIDLTVGFWLLSPVTRFYAMIISTAFHIMNSRLFHIGMFPYVCIATTPIFCDCNWPNLLMDKFLRRHRPINEIEKVEPITITKKRKLIVFLLQFYCSLQVFLPFSHSITKGYNNWTNGLYGYSWDMMVHSWDSAMVVVKVVDNESKREFFMNPLVWTHNQRWNKHGDMTVQYAQCLKENLIKQNCTNRNGSPILSQNLSIYIDVWCSLNNRFQQRMFNTKYDLLKANWSPFEPVEWLLPLLAENYLLRNTIKDIQKHVYSWSNYSDVLFIADFPGMHLENYIETDLSNVTLTVLSGYVIYEIEDLDKKQSVGILLSKGKFYKMEIGRFHKVHTIGLSPSVYMYTYFNQTRRELQLS